MEVAEALLDSQDGGGLLVQLGAALGSPFSNPGTQEGPLEPPGLPAEQQQGVGGQEEAPPPPATAAAPPASAAAEAYAALCTQELGVEPHPQILHDLGELADEAYAPAIPGSRPGQGGAVLRVPSDALPQQVQALLALVAGHALTVQHRGVSSSGTGRSGGGAAAEADAGARFFMQTVCLDLSGHVVSADQLRELLLEGPHRRRQRSLLQWLVLRACQLTSESFLQLLHSWKAFKVLEGLKHLDLSGNPLLGRTAGSQHAEQALQAARTLLQDPMVEAPAAGEAGAAAGGFLGPAQLHWLEIRFFQVASLRLMDIRRTGFCDAALGCLMRQLASYPSPQQQQQQQQQAVGSNAAAVGPDAPRHDGCRATLECLKLGPPADCQHFSEGTVAHIARVLATAPQLEVLELLGASPEAAAVLVPAWEQVQQQRGRQGYAAFTPDGRLRLSLTEEGAKVDAERAPSAHAPLQPPTPEPQRQQQAGAEQLPAPSAQHGMEAGEVQQRFASMGALRREPTAVQQQQHLTAYMQSRGQAPGDTTERQLGLLRMPSAAGPRQHRITGSAGSGRPSGGGSAGSGRASGGGSGAGAGGAWQRSRQQAGGPPRRRRRTTDGGSGGGVQRMYRGGARADELRVGEVDLLSDEDDGYSEDDEYEATDAEAASEEESSGSEGRAEAPAEPARRSRAAPGPAAAAGGGGGGDDSDEYSSVSDHPDYTSARDDWSRHYYTKMKDLVKKLKEIDPEAGRKAAKFRAAWVNSVDDFDRKRWKHPSRDQDDKYENLNALLSFKEIVAEHGLRYRFPMPRAKKRFVLEERARRAAQREQGLQQEEEEPQPRRQARAARRQLRKAGDLERAALEDSQDAEDGGAAAAASAADGAAAPTQHKRKQLVLEDSSSSSSSGSGSSDEEQQHGRTGRAGRAVWHTPGGPAAAAAGVATSDEEDEEEEEEEGGGGRDGMRGSEGPSGSGPPAQHQKRQRLHGGSPAAAPVPHPPPREQQPQPLQRGSSPMPAAAAGVQQAAPAFLAQPPRAAALVSSQVARAAEVAAAEAEAAAQRAFAGGANPGQPLQQVAVPPAERQQQPMAGPPATAALAAAAAEAAPVAAAEQDEEHPGSSPAKEGSSLIIPDSCSDEEFYGL